MCLPARPVLGLSSPVEAALAGSLACVLTGATVEEYRRRVADGVDRVAARLAGVDRPFTGITPRQLAAVFGGIDLDRPLGDATAALDELERVYLNDAVYFHHPRYVAHLCCPVVIPAVVGEAVLSAVNSSLDTWDQSAGATLIERQLIEWTACRVGLGDNADGVFTSGGTQSNLQALLIAREEARAGICGPDVLSRLRVFVSQCGHFSIAKSAMLLGLADGAVLTVQGDDAKRMQTVALARGLERCRRDGLIPMAVVATAGTTDFGSIDPLPEIADICQRYGVWLHVDAAYGCGLLVSPRRRHLLDGIECANSVTVDYHKSFFQPISCSAFLVRDRAMLRHATYHADYLNPASDARRQVPNQVDKSLQTTRRFDALKLWLTLRIMGPEAIGELFDAVLDRAAEVWRMLVADPRFEVVTEPQLSALVFRYIPPASADGELCDQVNLYARRALMATGEAMVASTIVDGRYYLKFTLLNPHTSGRDIAAVLGLLAGHADRYLAIVARQS